MTTQIHIIDVQSGNLQSLRNAIEYIGDYEIVFIRKLSDFKNESDKICKLIFPGVGNYGHFVNELNKRELTDPIIEYIEAGRSIMGICVGLQSFFAESEESPEVEGLGLIDIKLRKFNIKDPSILAKGHAKAVPHIGWNTVSQSNSQIKLSDVCKTTVLSSEEKYYFVHSYAAIIQNERDRKALADAEAKGWSFSIACYGSEYFLSSIAYKGLFATQFHPEKSGTAGLKILASFLGSEKLKNMASIPQYASERTDTGLSHRIIACLDVRANDAGDLVVTKGDSYDVRECSGDEKGQIRNLGKPVELATRYYHQGADEITFLNITSFRNSPIKDLPMLEVLRESARKIFVPLTVGGGIKDLIDPTTGEHFPADKVADLYFQAGADKVSIGSEAVLIAERYYASGRTKTGKSAVELISSRFGNQAVVISVDPKRVYLHDPSETSMSTIEIQSPSNYGPNGERFCYYQVTSQGGRKLHDLGALELCQACEDLGAGEILLNSIDTDGKNNGFNLELLAQVKCGVSIPVIASSGAGRPEHFEEVFRLPCGIDAALGAGMFHRGEYDVNSVKKYLGGTAKMDVRMDVYEI